MNKTSVFYLQVIVQKTMKMNETPQNRVPDTMPFVPIPKDLTKVKTKVVLNLTKRQLICFSLAGAVGVPTYLFSRTAIGGTGAVFAMIGLMLPFFFFAMYEKDGRPAEKILMNFIRVRLYFPGKRPYKTDNLYFYLTAKEEFSIAGQNKAAGKARKKTASGKKASTASNKKA